jgi:hypothetical protein
MIGSNHNTQTFKIWVEGYQILNNTLLSQIGVMNRKTAKWGKQARILHDSAIYFQLVEELGSFNLT